MGPRAVPGITHVGLDDSRLLRTGSKFFSARAGSNRWSLLFFHRPMVIGKADDRIFIYFDRKSLHRPNTTLMYRTSVMIATHFVICG